MKDEETKKKMKKEFVFGENLGPVNLRLNCEYMFACIANRVTLWQNTMRTNDMSLLLYVRFLDSLWLFRLLVLSLFLLFFCLLSFIRVCVCVCSTVYAPW